MERKPITVPSSSESKLVSIAKDWLAGGVSAGVSKTIVAPIGNLPTQHVVCHERSLSLSTNSTPVSCDTCIDTLLQMCSLCLARETDSHHQCLLPERISSEPPPDAFTHVL